MNSTLQEGKSQSGKHVDPAMLGVRPSGSTSSGPAGHPLRAPESRRADALSARRRPSYSIEDADLVRRAEDAMHRLRRNLWTSSTTMTRCSPPPPSHGSSIWAAELSHVVLTQKVLVSNFSRRYRQRMRNSTSADAYEPMGVSVARHRPLDKSFHISVQRGPCLGKIPGAQEPSSKARQTQWMNDRNRTPVRDDGSRSCRCRFRPTASGPSSGVLRYVLGSQRTGLADSEASSLN
jgi:hypothetical protein